MAIVTSDILIKLSTKSGSAGNTTAQADPNASIGKYVSTTSYSGGTLHDLFDVITGDENYASTVDYRCLFVHNSHGSLTLIGPKLWITAETSGGADCTLATDNTAASAVGASSAQADFIATETTAPTAVSAFSGPTSKATGLSLGDIASGYVKAFWIKRAAADTAAIDSDGFTFRVEGDTQA